MSTDKSARAVEVLMDTDPAFVELTEMLYGPGVDARLVWADVFGKSSPDQADVHVAGSMPARQARARRALSPQQDRKARAFTAGASAVGAVAGGLGFTEGLRGLREARQLGQPVRRMTRALLAVEPVGLAGEVGATHFLGRDARNRKQPVAKTSMQGLVRGTLTQHRRLVKVTLDAARDPKPYVDHGPAQLRGRDVGKRVTADWAGEFAKFDDDKRLALGWASICKVNGMPIVDRQGDYIDADDLEDAVYAYVERSRVGGDMHDRAVGKSNGRGLWFGLYGVDPLPDQPRQVADLVESVVITKSKKQAMGLPDDYPEGWWVGFRYHDDAVWDAIKKGERTGFSIHGSGLRKSIDYDTLMATR